MLYRLRADVLVSSPSSRYGSALKVRSIKKYYQFGTGLFTILIFFVANRYRITDRNRSDRRVQYASTGTKTQIIVLR